MSDEPSTGDTAPGVPSDGHTQELPAVSENPAAGEPGETSQSPTNHAEVSRQEEFPIDEAMLAAFLGEATPPSPQESGQETDQESAGGDTETVEVAEAEAEAAVSEPEEVQTGATDEQVTEDVTEDAEEIAVAATAAAAAGTTAGPVSHAAPRRSRWGSVLTTIGVLLIVAAVGAGAFYVGRLTAPEPGIVVQKETVVEADAVSPSMAVGALPVPAPGTVLITTARVPNASWPVVLTGAEGLADNGGTAPGYRLVNAGISGAQVASILASTFGAAGSVDETVSGWQVGAEGEPRVVVLNDPLYSWTYVDQAALDLPDDGPAFEPAAAITAATDVLQGIGVDISTVEYELETINGRTAVNAWQVVEGQRTQLGWRLVLDSDGTVLQASGFSSGLEAVPDYPIVGAASAVTRSQQSPWSSLPASPITGPTDGDVEPAPRPSASGVPQVDLPVSTVAVVGADLGLAQYWQPDGSILLLPSWILTGSDGSTWSLLAVAEPAVAFVDQPFPIDGEALGFVAGAFPTDVADGAAEDALAEEELLPGEAGEDAPLTEGGSDVSVPSDDTVDEGTVDENGDVLFDPSSDPAAAQ